MVTLLDASEVQTRLRLRSRTKTLEIMRRLPHIDLSPAGSKKQNLRVTEDTLDAYCRGRLNLDERNVIPMPQKPAQKRQNQKLNPEFVAYRR